MSYKAAGGGPLQSAMMKTLTTLLCLVLLGTAAHAFYEGHGPVMSLTPADFDRKVRGDDGAIWLVEFYANW